MFSYAEQSFSTEDVNKSYFLLFPADFLEKSKKMTQMMEALLLQSTTHTITTYTILHDDGEVEFFEVTESPEGIFINDPFISEKAFNSAGITEVFRLRRFSYG